MTEIARRDAVAHFSAFESTAAFTFDDLTELFRMMSRCCLTHATWALSEVDAILAHGHSITGSEWADGPKDETESQSITIVSLRGGMYGLLAESEDYTGHGCQCWSYTNRFHNLEDLVRGCVEGGERDFVTSRLVGWLALQASDDD